MRELHFGGPAASDAHDRQVLRNINLEIVVRAKSSQQDRPGRRMMAIQHLPKHHHHLDRVQSFPRTVVMMNRNWQAERGGLIAEEGLQFNKSARGETKVFMEHMVHQNDIMANILSRLEAKLQKEGSSNAS